MELSVFEWFTYKKLLTCQCGGMVYAAGLSPAILTDMQVRLLSLVLLTTELYGSDTMLGSSKEGISSFVRMPLPTA